jgi:hypothetical protein
MQSDGDSNGRANHSRPGPHLTDARLRSSLRFAERRLRSLDTEHKALQRAYRHEIATIRRQLIDRLLKRMIAQDAPLSEAQRDELRLRFEERALSAAQIAGLVRTVSRGRTNETSSLSEIEAMALLLRLEKE